MGYNNEIYIKCDECNKEIKLYEEHFAKVYLNKSLDLNGVYICCSVECLDKYEINN